MQLSASGSLAKKGGLVFDADSMSLICRYSDEISAYRARRDWMTLLKDEFLLERDRDYELQVLHGKETGSFFLGCSFTSACGRYAFWRLLNRQAPEVEDRLAGRPVSKRTRKNSLLGSLFSGTPRDTLSEAERIIEDSRRDRRLWDKLQRMFN